MEEHLVDVRDLDTEYFVNIRLWLDRAANRFYLPRESVERLGEPHDGDDFALLDGSVVTRAEEVVIDGRTVRVWAVPVGQLVTRPARRTP